MNNDKVMESLKKCKEFYNSLVEAKVKVPAALWVKGAATISMIDEALASDHWQPIETLKAKEGAYQLWHNRYGWIPSAQYVKDMRTHGGLKTGWLAHKDNTCHNEKEITHWMPLPSPPKKQ